MYIHDLKPEAALQKKTYTLYEILTGEGAESLWMMHNGTMKDIVHDLEKHRSDTYHFVNYYLRKILEKDPLLIHDEFFQEMIQKTISTGAVTKMGTNKLLFLNGLGDTVYVNKDSGTEHKGVWISNDYSIKKPSPPITYNYGGNYNTNRSYYNRYNDNTDVEEDETPSNVTSLKKSQDTTTTPFY